MSDTQAKLIHGHPIAQRIKDEVRAAAGELRAQGHNVCLDAVLVGEADAGMIYARSQQKRCEDVGIEYRLHALPDNCTNEHVHQLINRLNADPGVTGILLNLPMPEQIDASAMQYYIDPYKDVEGVNPSNIGLLHYDNPIIAPCTALAVMEMLKEAGCVVKGLDAVVVGQGPIVGKPISIFLLHELATVTACHIETRDLQSHTSRADLLVVAVGRTDLIGARHVKPGAIVVDVGINSVVNEAGERKIVGDVRFDEVAGKAGVITPVPGGVGPVTVAILLRNAVEAARKQLATPRRL